MSAVRILAVLWALLLLPSASAHVMLAQHGTVNLVGNQVYLVLSLPASAFKGVDDDGDGLLSLKELQAHVADLEAQWKAGVEVSSAGRTAALDGVLFNLSPAEHGPQSPAAQVVAMARFTVSPSSDPMELRLGLWGTGTGEQQADILVRRQDEKQLLRFRPDRERLAMLPPPWTVFTDFVRLGADHILSGADHLLFLLVVVASGWRPGALLLALTCFTAGHAVTLAASVLGGLAVPPSVVEPAIAATIVGMAGLDLRGVLLARPVASQVRLFLIFGCALVHGLGLADALTGLGLDRKNTWLSLAGFNVGVELAQVAFATVALAALSAGRRLCAPFVRQMIQRGSLMAAIAIGGIWLVHRFTSAA
jgi:HupE / UreJ protein